MNSLVAVDCGLLFRVPPGMQRTAIADAPVRPTRHERPGRPAGARRAPRIELPEREARPAVVHREVEEAPTVPEPAWLEDVERWDGMA